MMQKSTILLCLIFATPVSAQTDDRALRDLTTDRPDKTEAPQTVDAGHFQIELDGATYTRDHGDGMRIDTIAIAPFNLKYGIGRDTDVQLVVAPYQRVNVADPATGDKASVSGFGDISVRVKHNIWGNDGGATALAVMPFVTLPTAKRGLGADGVEFGIIVPLSLTLTGSIDLGVMTEIDGLRDDDRYRASFVNSATFGFALADRLRLYTELYTEHDRDWIVTGDAGLTYTIGRNAQIDTGVNLGLTRAADDIQLFVGFSRRFR